MSLEGAKHRGEKAATPARLRLAPEAQLKLTVKEIKIEGEENIGKIPNGAQVIIATTHISDIDMPIVSACLRIN